MAGRAVLDRIGYKGVAFGLMAYAGATYVGYYWYNNKFGGHHSQRFAATQVRLGDLGASSEDGHESAATRHLRQQVESIEARRSEFNNNSSNSTDMSNNDSTISSVLASATTATAPAAAAPTAAKATAATTQHESGSKATYDRIAKDYDSGLAWDEFVMALPLVRRWLIGNATGKVLEVAAGTGRNVKYLANSPSIDSITLTDVSTEMLSQARFKVPQDCTKPVRLRRMDATNLKFPDNEFDTVVQSFGMCSCDDPVAALKEMQRVCKPGGQILLLEHGQAAYGWLNGILDSHADRHREKWGCQWNKDIEALIQSSGLEIVSYRRMHFGTTHYIVAKPVKPRAS